MAKSRWLCRNNIRTKACDDRYDVAGQLAQVSLGIPAGAQRIGHIDDYGEDDGNADDNVNDEPDGYSGFRIDGIEVIQTQGDQCGEQAEGAEGFSGDEHGIASGPGKGRSPAHFLSFPFI